LKLKHEKIRFRRGEIAGLHTYPSARQQPVRHARLRKVHGLGRLVAGVAIAVAALCVVLTSLVLAVGSFGFNGDRLREEAQAALSRLAGQPVETSLGPARISLDRARFVALDLEAVEIASGDGRAPHIRAGKLRFGLHLLPLLTGRIELGSASLSDARIDLSGWQGEGGGNWRKAIGGDDGMIDADELLTAVFVEVHRAFEAVSPSGKGSFALSDVELRLPAALPLQSVHVESATIVRESPERLRVEAQLDVDGQKVAIDGEAMRPHAEPGAASFALKLMSEPTGAPVPQEMRADPDAPHFWPGSFSLDLAGDQSANAGAGEISARLAFSGTQLKFRRSSALSAGGTVEFMVAGGTDKVEFSRIEIDAGRSRLVFSGALGPQPAPNDETASLPYYRFELVSDGVVLAPTDANEPPLPAAIRAAGRVSNDWQQLMADEIVVRTDQGDVVGSGSMTLAGSETPALALAITVSGLPVGYAKSLWPWFAASKAREWALANVYGGVIEDGQLVLDARPGSLATDVPLAPEEISGHFEVRGTRFDVTGTIPPVRDAVGAIDFKGTDVDIALTSGTVFMPSGRTLAARNGTFRIADAHLRALVGDLDIEIEGEAAAVAEMGSYDPINMERFVDLAPESLSGDVTGRIDARIPLERGPDASPALNDLDWQVDLAYSDLSIAKPFEGQLVTAATGTISARPERAVIQATARLNGVPAEISLNEPLRDTGKRSLTARLHLDNASRDKLFPGLSSLVSGPFVVELEALGEGRQKVDIDLGGTVLSLPWVGWTKGAGVPARARFVLASKGGVSRLSDFRLDGEGFGAAGDLTVDGDGLAAAQFSRFALNRGDDVRASVQRRRGGYTVSVNGASFDARPVIRRFGDLTGAAAPDGAPAAADDISIEARVDEVGGFHGEVLKDVKLAYSAAGTTVGGIRASAVTRTGARVTVVDATAGGGRKIEAQAGDAGAVLRFLDTYAHLYGGTAALSLSGRVGGPLTGQIDLRSFAIVNEARLESIVSKAPPGGDRSLNQAVRGDLDVSQAKFERGFARIEKGKGYLSLTDGVVRGPDIGSTFQGTLFDGNGNMAITGTFMPAYGLNRIFGEIPLLGQILGNGRDRGLIGITFRLAGKTSEPKLEVNPLSVVAPGIFRSIFEYR